MTSKAKLNSLIRAAKSDPSGGKVLLPIELAEAILAEMEKEQTP